MTKKPDFDSNVFRTSFHYEGTLGAERTTEATAFSVWAPTASAVKLHLYSSGHRKVKPRTFEMLKGAKGTWTCSFDEDLSGTYYTFQAKIRGRWMEEAVDPYARAVGANGLRGMVVNLEHTNPAGWSGDTSPAFDDPTDAVIYELHVRDATIHPRSGAKNKGLFLGLAERGTRGPNGVRTGLDHIRELGVTHVHLLPLNDYFTVNELERPQTRYNWGYDPQNYNVPEGSYATNAAEGEVRIREFKTLVKAMHRAGLRVVMDVVYNHTFKSVDSHFNLLVPGYYYRQDRKGGFSNGSGCGNETASDRSMFRRYMIDSLVYWATEYHIDGFRFDLMGLHDIETMNQIREELNKVDSSILLYGEGWIGGPSPYPADRLAMKTHARQLNGIAAFSDDMRDSVKGPVDKEKEGGFVQGFSGKEEHLKAAVVASTRHKQVAYPKGNDWRGPWASDPAKCVSYISCHDNHALWDKILLTTPRVPEKDRIRMNKLAAAIVMTSQGIAFMHAGEELLRTKKKVENSYNHPDSINRIDWSRKSRYREVFRYYKGLIAMRRAHRAFRMMKSADVRKHLSFLDLPEGLVGFVIDKAAGDVSGDIAVIYNANEDTRSVTLPSASWHVIADDKRAGNRSLQYVRGKQVDVPRRAALVLVKKPV